MSLINEKNSNIGLESKKINLTIKMKKKYIAVFLIKEKDSYTELSRKKFNPTITEIKYQNKTFIIDISNYTCSKGLKQYYFLDIEKTNNSQLLFDNSKNESGITPEIIDMVISRKIIHQLTSNLTDSAFKLNLMMIFIGLCMGGLLGYIIGGL